MLEIGLNDDRGSGLQCLRDLSVCFQVPAKNARLGAESLLIATNSPFSLTLISIFDN